MNILGAGAGFFGIPPEPARKRGGQPAAWSPGDEMRLGFLLKFLEKCPLCLSLNFF